MSIALQRKRSVDIRDLAEHLFLFRSLRRTFFLFSFIYAPHFIQAPYIFYTDFVSHGNCSSLPLVMRFHIILKYILCLCTCYVFRWIFAPQAVDVSVRNLNCFIKNDTHTHTMMNVASIFINILFAFICIHLCDDFASSKMTRKHLRCIFGIQMIHYDDVWVWFARVQYGSKFGFLFISTNYTEKLCQSSPRPSACLQNYQMAN